MKDKKYYELFKSWKEYLDTHSKEKNTKISETDMEWLELILKDSKKRFENEIGYFLSDIEKLKNYDYMEQRCNFAKRQIEQSKLKIDVIENLLSKYF